jgi:hypothetical protein
MAVAEAATGDPGTARMMAHQMTLAGKTLRVEVKMFLLTFSGVLGFVRAMWCQRRLKKILRAGF